MESSMDGAILGIFGGGFLLIYLAIIVLMIVSNWKIFTKADQPGWASIIPIYNIYVMNQIAGFETWMFLLALVPFVNAVYSIILWYKMLNKFVDTGIAILGILFPIFVLPYIAFSSSVEYQG
jgi:hypothetical protein